MNKKDRERALELHKIWQGKIEIKSRVPVRTPEDLALAYTPGVAEPCLAIQEDVDASFDYTRRWNMCMLATDGSAVLGLGNLGPEAAMPVMESKSMIFKDMADIDAFPLCIKSNDTQEIVRTIQLLSGSFGAICLEEIAAPRCFEIERTLRKRLKMPVFHNDQHGVAIMMLAALKNALKVVNKREEDVKIVINGAGAAGIATGMLLLRSGFDNILLCDKEGIILEGGAVGLNEMQAIMARLTNLDKQSGQLVDALRGADVFIGTSGAGALTADMVQTMAKDPIVFANAQPVPEILPEQAMAGGAAVVGTSLRSEKNHLSNAMVFPGVIRGALNVRARDINGEMKLAAAQALAELVTESDLQQGKVLPAVIDPRIAPALAVAVAVAARETGVARK